MLSKGVGLFPTEPVGAMCEYVKLSESLGYDNVWFGDSQNIWRESSTVMGAAAVGTERIIFGTGVTNAVTRHPSLLASTWATLAEFTGGRVALGIGTGDSSLRTMGLKPLKLAELEQSIVDLRALFKGEKVVEPTSGAEYHLNYVTEPMNIPIYIAASAPKILRMSGRIADGVIVLVGTAPHFIEAALATIEAGAAESGRTLDDIHIVLWTPTAIDEDRTKARDLVRAHVSRVAIRPLPAKVEPSLEQAIDRIRESYDYYQHMNTEASHADLVPDELVDLFALAGTPDECAQRLKEIEALGVDQVSIVPFVRPGESRAPTIRTFAEIAGGRA
ncbi:5,10-methylenetetrahydromethanopterin reductase [Mycolicibacterium mageritense DSM 44476 = CIP 104973]|uniref:5,10-methylenetetrahydromethanopterin reductase n=1 Tax=Mycolicibacterium mageritense TaxID=53462 RepID=A0AAI8TXT9_MYCME|nr:LLM class flavin-dependent oxidoreductase [Mycolicibacterium mageritense]MCC9185500.1 LLM class flavin-dependent oxidoreductase [Mycolicibacterium mageritense]BBX36161.1 5,10-methylenetetrahydromethanopterin reductase [Mycolicibacterium mageritense]BDY30989.1 F420-dependent glucose-6-phosphate dehydrogenase [Mycolicibacterium mageritense]CDO24276.1 5,10-methylenetetrahydromethanopterin reductase [Mycolicibacterium mageritense DSM 44476 = CIP 104973]